MIETILLGVIVVLALLLAWKDWLYGKERTKFLNALIAKNATEVVNLEMAQKTKPMQREEQNPDIVPIESLTDDEFEKVIQREIS